MASAVRLAPVCSDRTGTAPHSAAATTAATGIRAGRIIEWTKLDITEVRCRDRVTRSGKATAENAESAKPNCSLRALRALRLPSVTWCAAQVCCAMLAVAVLACSGGAPSPQVRREPGLNVLLITIDTLRADAV